MANQVVDEAAVERLQQEIARVRLRLAEAIAMAAELPEPDRAGAEPTRVGRLHRIFNLKSEW